MSCAKSLAPRRWKCASANRQRATGWCAPISMSRSGSRSRAIDERNMKAIPRKQRAMVRKGIQNGLVSVCNHDMAVLHRVYAESVRNLGTPVFSRRYFAMLNEAFGDCSDVVTVLDAERPIASVLNFYFRDEVLPYYGGGTARGAAARGQRLHVLGGDAARRRPRLPAVRLRPQQAGHRRLRLQAQLGLRAGTAALSLPPRARCGGSRTTTRSTRNTGCSSRPGSVCRWRWPICSARRSCAGSAERDARSAVPVAPHPLSAGQGRQDPRLEHFPPSGAHASHPSRLLHRRSGGPPASRGARRALCGSRSASRSIRASSVSRRCFGCAPAGRCRSAISRTAGYSAGSMPSWRAARSIASTCSPPPWRATSCMPRASGASSTWWTSIPRNGPPTPRPHASRRAISGRARGARCSPSSAARPRISITACSSRSTSGGAS